MSDITVTGEGVDLFRLLSLKYQLKLESKGIKSSGGAIRPRIAKEFGLSPRAPHSAYIDMIREKIEEIQYAQAQ